MKDHIYKTNTSLRLAAEYTAWRVQKKVSWKLEKWSISYEQVASIACHGSSHKAVTSVPGEPMLSSTFHGHRTRYTDIFVGKTSMHIHFLVSILSVCWYMLFADTLWKLHGKLLSTTNYGDGNQFKMIQRMAIREWNLALHWAQALINTPLF